MRKIPAFRLKTSATITALVAAACLVALPAHVATASSPSSAWTMASVPSPTGHWHAVDHVGGLWIALGYGAHVAISRDGSTWAEHPAPAGSWQTVVYGNGRFVALSSVGAGAHEMMSTNGVSWTALDGPAGAWTSITFGAGRFEAVSSIGQIITSTDAVHWTPTWVHSKFHFTSIAYGNGRFIAVDNAQGDVLISLNGISWSFYPITTAGQHWSAVTFGDGNFVAVDNSQSGVVATSVLGYVWTTHRHSPAQKIAGMAYGCNSFVAAGPEQGSTSNLFSSSTGASWHGAATPAAAASDWTAVAYGAFRFVAVASDGRIASTHLSANCASTTPLAPQDVSGNLPTGGQVWTYMHPPLSAGGAPVDGYRVTITNGTLTRQCHAAGYYQPNCIISGLTDHQVYQVTTQAHNRFGYSVPSDPQFVIPVGSRSLSAVTATPVVMNSAPTVVQVTGVVANGQGIYPQSWVSVHFGGQRFSCQPSPFGECLIRVSAARIGPTSVSATYTGYGRSYSSPISHVTVAAVTLSSSNVAAKHALIVTVRGAVAASIAHANFGAKNFQRHLDGNGSGSIQVSSPTIPAKYFLTVQDDGVSLDKLAVFVHG